MYYPLGVTDPDYCVLKFTAENGRMYENFAIAGKTTRLSASSISLRLKGN
jgi:general stress protein 26